MVPGTAGEEKTTKNNKSFEQNYKSKTNKTYTTSINTQRNIEKEMSTGQNDDRGDTLDMASRIIHESENHRIRNGSESERDMLCGRTLRTNASFDTVCATYRVTSSANSPDMPTCHLREL